MYDMNFKPQIFTDITKPAKQSDSPNTGKVSESQSATDQVPYMSIYCGFNYSVILNNTVANLEFDKISQSCKHS